MENGDRNRGDTHSRIHLPVHHRAVRIVLGLRRIHRLIIQTRSGPPSWKPCVPADCKIFHNVHRRQSRRHRGQRDERPLLRIDHTAPLPDHHLLRKEDGRPAGKRGILCRPSDCNIGQRRRGSIGILLLRHILVLRRRRRGLCDVVIVHGPRRMGDDQVVRAG